MKRLFILFFLLFIGSIAEAQKEKCLVSKIIHSSKDQILKTESFQYSTKGLLLVHEVSHSPVNKLNYTEKTEYSYYPNGKTSKISFYLNGELLSYEEYENNNSKKPSFVKKDKNNEVKISFANNSNGHLKKYFNEDGTVDTTEEITLDEAENEVAIIVKDKDQKIALKNEKQFDKKNRLVKAKSEDVLNNSATEITYSYHENDEIDQESIWSDGKLVSLKKTILLDANKKSIQQFDSRNTLQNELIVTSDADGNKLKEDFYYGGILNSAKSFEYSSEGNLIVESLLDQNRKEIGRIKYDYICE